MSYERLLKIDKPFFTQYDVAHSSGTKLTSAEVLCSRYVKRGLFIRSKSNIPSPLKTGSSTFHYSMCEVKTSSL